MPLTMSSPASSASISAGIHSAIERAAAVGDADDQRARAARVGLSRPQVRQAGGHGRSRQRVFADALVRRPVAQPERGLRVRGIGGVAEEQQVRARDVDDHRGRGSMRGSAEAVAKEIPVVQHDQERQRGHSRERVVQARTERPGARAPDADREPAPRAARTGPRAAGRSARRTATAESCRSDSRSRRRGPVR